MRTVLITYRKVIFCFYPQYDIHSPPCQFCVSVALSVLTSSAWGSSLLKSWHGCQIPEEQGEALGSSWCRLFCSWASMQSHWGLGKLATLALAVQSSFHPQTALMLPSVDPFLLTVTEAVSMQWTDVPSPGTRTQDALKLGCRWADVLWILVLL